MNKLMNPVETKSNTLANTLMIIAINAEDANAFTNFEKGVAISLHDEPEAVCWEYLCKHLQSIKDMVNAVNISGQVTGYPTREMLYEKVGDAVLYLILLQAMFDKRIKEYEAENSVTL